MNEEQLVNNGRRRIFFTVHELTAPNMQANITYRFGKFPDAISATSTGGVHFQCSMVDDGILILANYVKATF